MGGLTHSEEWMGGGIVRMEKVRVAGGWDGAGTGIYTENTMLINK